MHGTIREHFEKLVHSKNATCARNCGPYCERFRIGTQASFKQRSSIMHMQKNTLCAGIEPDFFPRKMVVVFMLFAILSDRF